ncbi:MAG: histidinol-phosphate transaminase [Oscillospiraceae bacterium]|nr:histidinol-phosphate transaminase [Oscillospiraceae bacterium]
MTQPDKRLWSARIRDIVPYTPGEQPKGGKLIKLNTNENPYPPSPKALAAIADAAGEGLRRYPDPEADLLRDAVCDVYGVRREQVFPGNGSDEVLAFAFQAFFDPARAPIRFADITYSFYEVYTAFFGIPFEIIPLEEGFVLDTAGYCTGTAGGIVLANPNAPTGRGMPLDDLRAVLAANPDAVVIADEAYVEFGGVSALPLVEEFQNLLVVRTLSKSYSLAGLRVGFAVGDESLIAALSCVKNSINSYTLDRLAIVGGTAALLDRGYFARTTAQVVHTRESVAARLRALGFTVCPSQANFLFVAHPKVPGKVLFDGLRARSILVRRWDRPGITDYLRISIGTDEDMNALCAAIKELIV